MTPVSGAGPVEPAAVEQSLLDELEDVVEFAVDDRGSSQPDEAVRFVEGAEELHAHVVLGCADPVRQGCLAAISALGVHVRHRVFLSPPSIILPEGWRREAGALGAFAYAHGQMAQDSGILHRLAERVHHVEDVADDPGHRGRPRPADVQAGLGDRPRNVVEQPDPVGRRHVDRGRVGRRAPRSRPWSRPASRPKRSGAAVPTGARRASRWSSSAAVR